MRSAEQRRVSAAVPVVAFLVAADTPTGFRVNIPASGLPMPVGPPISPYPINRLDGFSPTVQILMHFPQGVDLERSDTSRLLPPGCCGQPAGPPWINTRTYDDRSLDADSPRCCSMPARVTACCTGSRTKGTRVDNLARRGPRHASGHQPDSGPSLHRRVAQSEDRRRSLTSSPSRPSRLARQPPTNIDAIESRRARWKASFRNARRQ
jgi:hypothetical protein